MIYYKKKLSDNVKPFNVIHFSKLQHFGRGVRRSRRLSSSRGDENVEKFVESFMSTGSVKLTTFKVVRLE